MRPVPRPKADRAAVAAAVGADTAAAAVAAAVATGSSSERKSKEGRSERGALFLSPERALFGTARPPDLGRRGDAAPDRRGPAARTANALPRGDGRHF